MDEVHFAILGFGDWAIAWLLMIASLVISLVIEVSFPIESPNQNREMK
jgi:hypothetical protein